LHSAHAVTSYAFFSSLAGREAFASYFEILFQTTADMQMYLYPRLQRMLSRHRNILDISPVEQQYLRC
jgi:hypothetical protein